MIGFIKVTCTCADGYKCRGMQDPNCCAHSCDYNDLVDCITELKQQNAELAAQVEVLRGALSKCRFESLNMTLSDWKEIQGAYRATPAQCLLEVKADAGRDGFVAGASIFWIECPEVQAEADNYANKIREAE